MTTVPIEALREALVRRLVEAGSSRETAEVQADMLVEAELRGLPSHGALRLNTLRQRIANGVCAPNALGKHSWRGTAWLDVDGESGFGPVVAQHALTAAARRTQETGVCLVTVRTSNHLGMLAWYAEHWARQGYVLIGLTTSEALVHPYGGTSRLLGTNPLTIGVPTADEEPLVVDLATSIVAMGKVHDYAGRGQALEPGWARDAQGRATTDAVAARSGAIAPFGGAKGYALGLGIEVLVTALTGSAIGTSVRGTLDATETASKGDVFILAPARGGALANLLADFLDEVRASDPADPARPVLVPGDRSRAERTRRIAEGVEVRDALWAEISHQNRTEQA
ncbi:Ldh family oxidoreductase [Leucobacter komagatae]|uniref:Dehydrogenase n=1 Tax=Leucobacter komagatae TaxID=55969 RepID=A0A0D0IIZ6_9MICO|nr:Ldh family oxidoreductase [Leucobacter komagatae]KIP51634.1 hypothetical protein SD72_14145 [Leucobacter komagatae]